MNPEEIGKVLVCLEDCDGTSVYGNMQEPWLKSLGINLGDFWGAAGKLPGEARQKSGVNIDKENAYMILFARCARGDNKYAEMFPQLRGISNADLREAGKLIKPFPGYPDYYLITKEQVRERYGKYGISLEHASVSTGFREMILGSPLSAPGGLDYVYASEFLEQEVEGKRIVYDIARAVGHQKKTEFLHMVNKGANAWPEINVNDNIPQSQRRVPWFNMIYSGDSGTHRTDHAAFATIRHKRSGLRRRRGFALAVYDPDSEEGEARAERFYREWKVDAYAPAPTTKESERLEIILEQLEKRAEQIVFNQKLKRVFSFF